MLKQKFLKINENPILASVLFLVIWAVMTNLLFVLANYVWVSILSFMFCFMILYPILTLMLCFMFAKRNGLVWYVPVAMILTVTAEYFFVANFNSITPNIIVTTILCTVFGSGIGSCFADQIAIDAAKEERRRKKLNEDKKYKKILDD